MSDQMNLSNIFQKFKDKGLFAKINYGCCGKHAVLDAISIIQDNSNLIGFVFFDQQETVQLMEDGKLYLSYGALNKAECLKIGDLVYSILKNTGYNPKWNNEYKTRILINVLEENIPDWLVERWNISNTEIGDSEPII